jgi:SAM-dependent methyltransferase
VLQSTLQDLPEDGEGYDAVFAVNVNAFWLNPQLEIPAARRILVPGGRLLLVLEAPSAERTRAFVADMPMYLEAHGFEDVTTAIRTDRLACVSARRPL